jgi:hypothetical protein
VPFARWLSPPPSPQSSSTSSRGAAPRSERVSDHDVPQASISFSPVQSVSSVGIQGPVQIA